ncbi:MAG: electron transport complex subunit RsxC [Thiolinea sp.]
MITDWLKKYSGHFGAIKLAGHKTESTQTATQTFTVKAGTELVLPLQQHMGSKPELQVKAGDYVYKGQQLAQAEGDISVPIHATTSGTITAITKRPIPHPSGLSDYCIILQADGRDDNGSHYLPQLTDYQQLDSHTLRQRIRDAGIVGLGGAVFPAAIKLNVRQHIPIHTLVINGAECEPYISCDEVLMREKAEEILAGVQIMLHILRTDESRQQTHCELHCQIGIEDNKAQAITCMEQAVAALNDPEISVVTIPTHYPAGGEKQLIHTLTRKEVPAGGRPADIGVICHNVATARAIYRAVVLGEPLISRYITVTGNGVQKPGNLEVPFGISISEVIHAAGGYRQQQPAQLVMGGPMMGIPLADDQIPVVKATNCILVTAEPKTSATPLPCIRCGQCAEHCPAGLLPQQLYWYAKARDFAKTEAHKLFDCIECGCCSYVCPSHIPLVDYYRFAKTEIRAQRTANQKSELARERHEFHNERLERAKRERAERLAKHKKKAVAGDKKDAIQAALERAKAKKAQLTQTKKQEGKDPDSGNERRRRRRRDSTPESGAKPAEITAMSASDISANAPVTPHNSELKAPAPHNKQDKQEAGQ